MQINKAAQIAWKVIIGAFAALIVSLSALAAWNSLADFPQYYVAAKLFASGQGADVYKPSTLVPLEHEIFPKMNRDEVYFCFPPYSMVVLTPLAMLSPQIAHYAWTCLSIAAFFLSLWVLKRTFALTGTQVLWLALILPVTGPYCQSIIMGQPSFFMLAGLCAFLWASQVKKSSPVAALALCAMLPKPHLAIPILVYLAGAKKFKLILAFSAAAAGIFLISLLAPGWDAYQSYFDFSKFANANPKIMNLDGCVTLRTQLLRFFPQAYNTINIVAIVSFLLGLGVLFWLGIRFAKRDDWVQMCALVALPVGFVTALYVQPYDLVLFIPSIVMYSFMLGEERIPKGLWVPVIGLVYLAIFQFFQYTTFYFIKGPFYPLFWAVLGWAVLTLVNAVKISRSQ